MDRSKRLFRLGIFWHQEIDDLSIAGRKHVIQRLDAALRAEYKRGRELHWAYSLPRHRDMLATYRLEVAALEKLEAARAAA